MQNEAASTGLSQHLTSLIVTILSPFYFSPRHKMLFEVLLLSVALLNTCFRLLIWFVLTVSQFITVNYTQFAIKQVSSATLKKQINIEIFMQVMLQIFLQPTREKRVTAANTSFPLKFKIHVPFNTRAKGNPHREPKSGKTRYLVLKQIVSSETKLEQKQKYTNRLT